MKYYIMSQDKRIQKGIQFAEFSTQQSIELGTEYIGKMKKSVTLHVQDEIHTIFSEVIEAPWLMVSDKVYKVIQMYDSDIAFSNAILSLKTQEVPLIYKIVLVDRIDCLHESTEFYKDRSIKRLVLDYGKIREQHLFRIEGISPNYMVVSMAVVESLLRRHCVGIQFQEIELA